MWVPHSGYSPTHSSLGWPPLNPSPARSCCFAAGLNTAHCVSAPSQPQTVPTNVLLIRWLNYSCKNNVDISLKIALCQILLAVIGPQPLLSNSPVWTPPPHHQQHHHRPCLPVYFWLLPCFSSPFKIFSPFIFPSVFHVTSWNTGELWEAKYSTNKQQRCVWWPWCQQENHEKLCGMWECILKQ